MNVPRVNVSPFVNGQESDYPINDYESEYSKIDKSGIICESGKNLLRIVSLVLILFALRGKWCVHSSSPAQLVLDSLHSLVLRPAGTQHIYRSGQIL